MPILPQTPTHNFRLVFNVIDYVEIVLNRQQNRRDLMHGRLRDINHLSLYHLMHNLKRVSLHAPHLWNKKNDANNSRYRDIVMTIIFLHEKAIPRHNLFVCFCPHKKYEVDLWWPF